MKKRFGISSGVIIVASFAAVLMATGAYGISKVKGNLGEYACISDGGSGGCDSGRALVGPSGVALSNEEGRFFAASYGSNAVVIMDRQKKKKSGAPPVGTLVQSANADQGCVSETGAGTCIDGRGLVGVTDVASADETVYWAASGSEAVGFAWRHRDEHYEMNSALGACIAETGAGGDCVDGRGLKGASSVEVPPGRANVYVGGDHTIAAFKRDKGSDYLTQFGGANGCINDDGSDGCTDGYVPGTIVDLWTVNNGRFLYAAVDGGIGTGAILVFSRDIHTGAITQANCVNATGSDGCTSDPTIINPTGVMSDKGNGGGDNLYVAVNGTNGVVWFARNKSTGGLSHAGCINELGTLGCTDGHNLIGAARVNVYKTNQFVEVTAGDGVASFGRDKATGALTQFPNPNGCITVTGDGGTCAQGDGLTDATGIVSSGGGKSIYVAGSGDNAIAEIVLDTNK